MMAAGASSSFDVAGQAYSLTPWLPLSMALITCCLSDLQQNGAYL
jgi:hypothetical protein